MSKTVETTTTPAPVTMLEAAAEALLTVEKRICHQTDRRVQVLGWS